MITLDSIKEKIRDLLIEKDGDIQPHELKFIIEEAKQIGITDKQIAKLVPEVDRAINWEHIRKQKEEEKERLRKFEEETKKKEEEIKSAPEFIDALIQYSLADGIVESKELQLLFAKAEQFKQDINALSRKIKTALDANKYKPHPNPDLKASTLKDTLLSTNWYNQQQYTIATTPPPPPPKPFPWKIVITSVVLVLLGGGVISYLFLNYNIKAKEAEIKLSVEKAKQDSIAFIREKELRKQKAKDDSVAYRREIELRKITPNNPVTANNQGENNNNTHSGTNIIKIEKPNKENTLNPNIYDKWGLQVPCFILNVVAVSTINEAKGEVNKLLKKGFKASYLWIPDYESLSGAKFYTVFIGPFTTQYECEKATEEYRKIHSSVYGLLVSHEKKRVEIRGIDKVKVINK